MDLSNVDVKDFLQSLDIRNITDGGEEIQFSCPFGEGHIGGDSTPSAYMNARSTAFLCHSCHAKGNAVHFLAKLEGITPLLAARYIRERYQKDFIDPGSSFLKELDDLWRTENVDEYEEIEIPDTMQELSGDPLDYMLDRGFTKECLDDWNIRYDPISSRIAIPIRTQEGKLVGWKGRGYREDQIPRYLGLGYKESEGPSNNPRYSFRTREKSRYVFGAERISYGEGIPTIVVEGELNAVSLSQKGFSNPIAINGSDISRHQEAIILSSCESLILFFDSDKAGYECTSRAIDLFEPHMSVKIVPEHEKDPADLTAEQCAILIKEAKSTFDLWIPSE